MVIYLRMFFYSGVQAAISFSNIVSVTSKAFEFINNRALLHFWCVVFKRDEAVSVSSFPVDNNFTRRL